MRVDAELNLRLPVVDRAGRLATERARTRVRADPVAALGLIQRGEGELSMLLVRVQLGIGSGGDLLRAYPFTHLLQ